MKYRKTVCEQSLCELHSFGINLQVKPNVPFFKEPIRSNVLGRYLGFLLVRVEESRSFRIGAGGMSLPQILDGFPTHVLLSYRLL